MPPRTLLVLWDAADWNLIEPMLEAGALPHLETLLAGGLLGWFPVPTPLDPSALATSLTTGLPPDVHGVLAWPDTATERRVPDLAARFAAAGRPALSVGWPGSHGTAPAPNLLCVSDTFDAAPASSASDPWPLPPGSVLPETLRDDIAEVRFHPAEFALPDLAPLIADINTLPLATEPRVSRIAMHLAASISRQAVATFLMENHPWHYAQVAFPGIEGISRECLEYQSPRLPHVSEQIFHRYQRAVDETYRLHDQMLGKLIAVAGPDATILLVSTRGVESGDARPTPLPGEHVETAAFHRAAGFCVLRAQDLREDDLLHGIALADLAPTLLWLADLPLPPGLPGSPLQQSVASRTSRAPPREDSSLALPPAPLRSLDHDTRAERRLHLAIAHLNAGRPAEALSLLEPLCDELPDRVSPVLHRILCLRALGRPADAMALLDQQAARPDGGVRPRPGRHARFVPHYDLMRGLLHLDEGRPDVALACFRTAVEARPQHAALHLHVARALLELGEHRQAEAALRHAVAIDPGEGEAQFLLGQLLAQQHRLPEALQPALESAAKMPHRPETHRLLGHILARLGRTADAEACREHAARLSRPTPGPPNRV